MGKKQTIQSVKTVRPVCENCVLFQSNSTDFGICGLASQKNRYIHSGSPVTVNKGFGCSQFR